MLTVHKKYYLKFERNGYFYKHMTEPYFRDISLSIDINRKFYITTICNSVPEISYVYFQCHRLRTVLTFPIIQLEDVYDLWHATCNGKNKGRESKVWTSRIIKIPQRLKQASKESGWTDK